MKKIIGIGLVGIVAFAASLGAGWFLNRPVSEDADEEVSTLSAPAPVSADTPNAPAAHDVETDLPLPVRPRPISTQEIFEIAMRLQDREAAVAQREQQVQDREDRLNLVFKDLELEQQQVEGLRAEVRSLLRDSELLLTQLGQDQQALAAQQAEMQTAINQLERAGENRVVANQQNIRMIADIFKGMEPEAAATQFESIANDGDMAFVIQVYAQLEQRDSAAIGEHIEPTLFNEIITGLRDYERPATTTPTRR